MQGAANEDGYHRTDPTFNRGAFLVSSLASVIRQTLEPEDVTVIHDGSTDDTREVLAQWIAGWPDRGDRILYLRQENQEKGAALNYGLQFGARQRL